MPRKPKSRKRATKVVVKIRTNRGTVNVHANGMVQRRRKTLRNKLDPHTQFKKADKRHREKLPPGVDLEQLVHASNVCIATRLIHAEWSHEPMVRFISSVRQHGYRVGYLQRLLFNDECQRQFGMDYRQQIGIFLDRVTRPRYIFFQNVDARFECPAHLHKLGTYTVLRNNGDVPAVVREDGNCMFLGLVGQNNYRKFPMCLFDMVPNLHNHCVRLQQAEERSDMLFAKLKELTPIPRWIGDKTRRIGRPIRSDSYPILPRLAPAPCELFG
jgi:hypothetical protein